MWNCINRKLWNLIFFSILLLRISLKLLEAKFNNCLREVRFLINKVKFKSNNNNKEFKLLFNSKNNNKSNNKYKNNNSKNSKNNNSKNKNKNKFKKNNIINNKGNNVQVEVIITKIRILTNKFKL